MLDLDLDKYWLEKNMPMYINNFTFWLSYFCFFNFIY
jgi:hypothetical protein